jgi:hypothetical protein
MEAVVVLLARDAAVAEGEVHRGVGPEAGAGREGRHGGGQRAGPDDPAHHVVARDQVVDDVEALVAHQLPPLLERREHPRAIALAPPRTEEVGVLDEPHVEVEEVADDRQVGGWVGDQREVALDDGRWIHLHNHSCTR